jgi:hypothetical protein
VCREALATSESGVACVLFNDTSSCGHGVCKDCVDAVISARRECPMCRAPAVAYFQQPIIMNSLSAPEVVRAEGPSCPVAEPASRASASGVSVPRT